jgi:hypothetical protein
MDESGLSVLQLSKSCTPDPPTISTSCTMVCTIDSGFKTDALSLLRAHIAIYCVCAENDSKWKTSHSRESEVKSADTFDEYSGGMMPMC